MFYNQSLCIVILMLCQRQYALDALRVRSPTPVHKTHCVVRVTSTINANKRMTQKLSVPATTKAQRHFTTNRTNQPLVTIRFSNIS